MSKSDEESLDRQVEADLQELKFHIQSPKVSPVAAAMKTRGFDIVEEVVKEGQFELSRTGKEPTVLDMVERVSKRYSYLTKGVPDKKPTLPGLKGGGQVATGKVISSIADLRAETLRLFAE